MHRTVVTREAYENGGQRLVDVFASCPPELNGRPAKAGGPNPEGGDV
jgi:hypothetical protein